LTLKKEAVIFPQNISKLLPEKKVSHPMRAFFMSQTDHMIINEAITYLTLYMRAIWKATFDSFRQNKGKVARSHMCSSVT
jgi:hypothetical protein